MPQTKLKNDLLVTGTVSVEGNLKFATDLGDIVDANNNELLEADTVASAVNYVRLANAATGSAPTLSAVGDDTNVALQLTPKGSAVVLLGTSSTGTVASGSVTINATRGSITTATLTAGTASSETFDLVNNRIGLSSQILVSIGRWTGTTGLLTPGEAEVNVAGSATIRLVNADSRPAGSALNGTALIHFIVLS